MVKREARNIFLERALEAPGAEFIDENGGGAGVQLRSALNSPKASS
jgi:hypothetical protein